MPSASDLTLHLFLQLAVILGVCQIVGLAARHVGQTQVVGEMASGFLLGPSIFGAIALSAQTWLFPLTLTLGAGDAAQTITHPSMTILGAISQVGIALYMFLVGLRFDTDQLRAHLQLTGRISLSGIAAPALLGGAIGWALWDDRRLFGADVASWQAALFLAAAMAVTAFPVLARILHDLGVIQTRVGTMALGSAAVDDAIAWCLLAVVLASFDQTAWTALLTIAGAAAYVAGMVFVVRPLMRRLGGHQHWVWVLLHRPAALLLAVMVCAWITEAIGIHAVFGAFVFGAILPRNSLAREAGTWLEPVTVGLLVPVFFAYAGLRTKFGLLDDPALLGITALVVLVAFVSKGGGCALTSRLGGVGWREAASIGALMNARGLMELILITIALERGLITQAMYTILAIMTVLTTIAASPLFRALYGPIPTRGHTGEPVE